MEQCESSNSFVTSCNETNPQRRKRLRSIIKPSGSVRPVRRYQSQREYNKIFERVLKVYLDSKQCQPLGSSFSILDSTLRSAFKRWTPDTCHTVVDFENAVKKALSEQPDLQQKFRLWFLRDEQPEFKAGDMLDYQRIIKKCAEEFLRRRMFPIWKWFRTPDRSARIFYAADTES